MSDPIDVLARLVARHRERPKNALIISAAQLEAVSVMFAAEQRRREQTPVPEVRTQDEGGK